MATWASTVLKGLSITPNATNVAALKMWASSEGNATGTNAKYNWLDSELSEAGSTNFNSAGVQNYTSYAQGVAATVATLKGSIWSGVVRALGTPGGTSPNATPSHAKTPINRVALTKIWTAIHTVVSTWMKPTAPTYEANYPVVMWTFLNGTGATAGGVWASNTITTETTNPTAPKKSPCTKSCVICVPNPFPFTSGGWCVLNKHQAKAIRGALLIVTGVGLGLTGLLVLAAAGFGSKAAKSGLSAIAGAAPGPIGTAVRAVSPAATRSAARRTSAKASLTSAQTRLKTAEAKKATLDEATALAEHSRQSIVRQRSYDRANNPSLTKATAGVQTGKKNRSTIPMTGDF